MEWLLWSVGAGPQTPKSERPQSSITSDGESGSSNNEATDYEEPAFNSSSYSPPMLPGEPTSESPHQVAETAETNDSNIFHAQTRRDEYCSGDESAMLSEIEESSFTHCNCVGMIQNCCVPYWRRMICIFHVVRSIPLPTILTFFVTLSGWIIMRSRTTVLRKVFHRTGLNIDGLESYVNGYAVFLISINGSLAIATAFLTGWTREALCASLRSGTFVYPDGGQCSCGCWAKCLYHNSGLLLLIMIVLSYGSLVIAVMGLSVANITWFVGYAGMISCRTAVDDEYADNETETDKATEDFFSVIFKTLFKLIDKDLGTDTFDAAHYCKLAEEVRLSLMLFLVGQFLIVCGQVNFVCLMVDKNRVVRYEERLMHAKSDFDNTNLPENYSSLRGGQDNDTRLSVRGRLTTLCRGPAAEAMR